MAPAYCKISLRKLTGKHTRTGYHDSEFKKLFGSTRIDPKLPFSRAGFFHSGLRHIQGMSISGIQQKLSLKKSAQHTLEVTAKGGGIHPLAQP